MNRSTKRFIFFYYLFHSNKHVCFQLVAFIREHLIIYLVFCLDLAQSHMNGALNETQTHPCTFVSQMFFSGFVLVYIKVTVLC